MSQSVFLSYAKEDHKKARKLYNDLKSHGIDVWFDKESLIPGQNWKNEIAKAIQNSRYFIALLSDNSVDKKGIVQSELSQALEEFKKYPPNQIYILPVRLNECIPSHPELNDLQWIDMFPKWGDSLEKILVILGKKTTIVYPFYKLPSGTDNISLPISIVNPHTNKSMTLFALVDTGADSTILPKSIAVALGHNLKSKSAIINMSQGIGGPEYKYKHTIDIFLLDSALKHKFVIAKNILYDFVDNNNIPALIGRDFFSRFRVEIDFPNKRVMVHGEFNEV